MQHAHFIFSHFSFLYQLGVFFQLGNFLVTNMQDIDERDQSARRKHRAATEPVTEHHPVKTGTPQGTLPK